MGRVFIPGFRKIEVSGSGQGGTTNYEDLTHKPSINNVPLVGNLNTANLKLTDATLTEEGVPAEAKTVGTKLEEQATSLTALSEQLGNHTVKSDVPENAVFTDTVYDDTEVQKRISDNGYGEVAGGKNLVLNTVYGYITVDRKINMDNQSTSYIFYAQAGKTYSFSGDETPTAQGVRFGKVSSINPKTEESVSDYNIIADGVSTFTTNETGYYMLYAYSTKTSGIKFQIEEGTQATEYESYFPSNKMLAEENTQQSSEMMDIKMLGWSVPKECPIQNEVNENQFVQKVGRIKFEDLQILDAYADGTRIRFYPIPAAKKEWQRVFYMDGYKPETTKDYDEWNESDDKTIGWLSTYEYIIIKDGSCTSQADFEKKLSGKYMYYKLDSPITMIIDGNEVTERVLVGLENDLDKLNSLPIGTIIQLDAAKDNIETTEQKYGWQYLGTSNIECNDGSVKLLVTNVYRKNN